MGVVICTKAGQARREIVNAVFIGLLYLHRRVVLDRHGLFSREIAVDESDNVICIISSCTKLQSADSPTPVGSCTQCPPS